MSHDATSCCSLFGHVDSAVGDMRLASIVGHVITIQTRPHIKSLWVVRGRWSVPAEMSSDWPWRLRCPGRGVTSHSGRGTCCLCHRFYCSAVRRSDQHIRPADSTPSCHLLHAVGGDICWPHSLVKPFVNSTSRQHRQQQQQQQQQRRNLLATETWHVILLFKPYGIMCMYIYEHSLSIALSVSLVCFLLVFYYLSGA